VLREKELLAAGVDVGPLRQITVVVGRAGGGKWHVPAKEAGWRSHCRYAQHLTGSPLALLDVREQLCRHCAPVVCVKPGEDALWRAAAEVVVADRAGAQAGGAGGGPAVLGGLCAGAVGSGPPPRCRRARKA
jgi:hypothetical protein